GEQATAYVSHLMQNQPFDLLYALDEYADLILLEAYIGEASAPRYNRLRYPFPTFRDVLTAWESKRKGIIRKVVIILRAQESFPGKPTSQDSLPSIDYRDFIQAQVKSIAKDPFLRDEIAGIGFFKVYSNSYESVRYWDEVITYRLLGTQFVPDPDNSKFEYS